MRIQAEEMQKTFEEILIGRSVPSDIAQIAARNFTQTSLDGVYSHGVNRFPRLIEYLDKGVVNPQGRPECVARVGNLERGEGRM